jgi:D-amino peptidase
VKIYIMTDMEGVAGVVSSTDYCAPTSRYYEVGRELTTRETNAAIEGAIEAGAKDFLVVDGHGHGAINPQLLHPAARLLTGRPMGYPFGCDASFDGAFVVGQHAKANVDGGHLAHSGSFTVEDQVLNGRSLGELGINMLFAAYFGVPTLLVTGDAACCEEAHDLVPEVETVAVKEGLKRGALAGLTGAQAVVYNGAAIHLHPSVACERIRAGAERALARRATIPRFWIVPPYSLERTFRPGEDGSIPAPAVQEGDDLIEVLKQPARRLVASASGV